MVAIKDIIEFLQTTDIEFYFNGRENIIIEGLSSFKNCKNNTITWVKDACAITSDTFSADSVLVVTNLDNNDRFVNRIVTKDHKRAFFSIAEKFFYCEVTKVPSVGKGSYIGEQVSLGQNVKIGYNCVLDGEISIGDNTIIYNNVSIINKVIIGENCIIQSNTAIGHDGYGYVRHGEEITMIKHYGGVRIGKNVFIGTNCEIARGTIDDTVVKDGCKIDGLCHIAHNVVLEKNVSLVAGTLLYGSAHLDEDAYVASGIVRNQIYVGKGAFIGMGSVVTHNVEAKQVLIGIPAKPLKNG